jgi:hypothetical protein
VQRVDDPLGVERVDLDAGVAVAERPLADELVEERRQVVVGVRSRVRRSRARDESDQDGDVSERGQPSDCIKEARGLDIYEAR